MKTIILISCVKDKLPRAAKAKNLFISPIFQKSLAWARQQKPDGIYILSVRYGLIDLQEEVKPYALTINTMSLKERNEWTKKVLGQLAEVADLQNDRFIFLSGTKYREFLLPHLTHYEIPMQGLPIDEQLAYLDERLTK